MIILQQIQVFEISLPAFGKFDALYANMVGRKKNDIFSRFTSSIALAMGHAWVFVGALVILLAWAISGPLLEFSDTWQLIINTSTTIITFLMVFIIQNTQNRDNIAINLKLDAMLKKMGLDKKDLIKAEEESDKKLQEDKKKMQSG
jgi:low affinity Fe/Cu permease